MVVDHDSRRLIWAAPGRDKATLAKFFDLHGTERRALITHVSADAAQWIADVVAECCPGAVRCADAFHVVAWATDALDELRRQAWNTAARWPAPSRGARGGGHQPTRATTRTRTSPSAQARPLRVVEEPENLTERQADKLAWIATTDPRLHRGYLLKEGLRYVFKVKGQAGKDALDRWLSWAARCRIPPSSSSARRSESTAPRSRRHSSTTRRTR